MFGCTAATPSSHVHSSSAPSDTPVYCASLQALANVNGDSCAFLTSCCFGEIARCVCSWVGVGSHSLMIMAMMDSYRPPVFSSFPNYGRVAAFTEQDIARTDKACPGTRAVAASTCTRGGA